MVSCLFSKWLTDRESLLQMKEMEDLLIVGEVFPPTLSVD
jgi:hypothetical protein